MSFIKNLAIIVYQVLALSLICAFLFTSVTLLKGKSSWRQFIKQWMTEFRKNSVFRCRFFLMVSVFGIMGITLLARRIWYTPWSNVIGNFALIRPDGKLDEDICNNILLFIPFGGFLFASRIKRIDNFIHKGQRLCLGQVLLCAAFISFGFSLAIEICQSVFWLGTFQLADIFYNTIGALMGGLLYFIGKVLRRRDS